MALVMEKSIPYHFGVPEKMMIVTEVTVVNPITGKRKPYRAVWDTGATGSLITKKVATDLELQRVSDGTANGMTGKRDAIPIYLAHFVIENIDVKLSLPFEMDAYNDGIDVAIGMDIIGNGDFSLTRQADGSIRMRFQSPPACFSDLPNTKLPK